MAWTAPRTWSVSEFVTAALLNTHIRDNLLFLKSNPEIATATGTSVTADNRGADYTGATASGTGLANIAIPADVGAVYVELWSHQGTTFGVLPGGGVNYAYSLTVTDSVAGTLITFSQVSSQATEGWEHGLYARTPDLAWAGTTRTLTLDVAATNCMFVLNPYVLRIMRAY